MLLFSRVTLNLIALFPIFYGSLSASHHSCKKTQGSRFLWRPKHFSTLCCKLWTLTPLPISRIRTCPFCPALSWYVSGASTSPATRLFLEPCWPTPTTALNPPACWSSSTGAPFCRKYIMENTTTALQPWWKESEGKVLGWMNHQYLLPIQGRHPFWSQTQPYTRCPKPTLWHVSTMSFEMMGSCMSHGSGLQVLRWHTSTMTQDFTARWCLTCGRLTSRFHNAWQTTLLNGSRRTYKDFWLQISFLFSSTCTVICFCQLAVSFLLLLLLLNIFRSVETPLYPHICFSLWNISG